MKEVGREGGRGGCIGRRGAGRKMGFVCHLGEWEKKRRNFNILDLLVKIRCRVRHITHYTLNTE